ncbi:hypothetical protein [Shewanella benthica]|nr:hypothetical protein [Shewanella benthica]
MEKFHTLLFSIFLLLVVAGGVPNGGMVMIDVFLYQEGLTS